MASGRVREELSRRRRQERERQQRAEEQRQERARREHMRELSRSELEALATDPRRTKSHSTRKQQWEPVDWSLGFTKPNVIEYAKEELQRRGQYGSGGARGREGSTRLQGVDSSTMTERSRSLDTLLKGVLGGLGFLSLLALLSD